MNNMRTMYGLCAKYGIETDGKTPRELWREIHEAEERKRTEAARRMGVDREDDPDEEYSFGSRGLRVRTEGDDSDLPLSDNKYIGRYHSKEEMERRINAFINEYQHQPVENALVFLPNGDVWFSKGEKDSVLRGMPVSLKGATVIHNHPDSQTQYSFSGNDIDYFCKNQLKTLYGFDHKYIYVITSEDTFIDHLPNEELIEENCHHAETIRKVTKKQKAMSIGYRRYKF